MVGIIWGINWVVLLLVGLTYFMVVTDRAFSRKIRIKFETGLIVSTCLLLVSQHFQIYSGISADIIQKVTFYIEVILRIAVIILLVSLVKTLLRKKNDYIISTVMLVMLALSIITEAATKAFDLIDSTLCIVICVYYFYFVIQTYKKDNLTGLLIRHNLNFEMTDLKNKQYDVVLIDVDNFKLINDKYGHDKGDEALVTVSSAVESALPKGCRFYRFGGDEFVIISQKVSQDVLTKALEEVNEALKDKELRISYGITRHNPGDDGNRALFDADQKMYDNKMKIKSEDIWDYMTGLYNYRGFQDELSVFRKDVESQDCIAVLVAVDIDRLSNINMAYGYTEGNIAVKSLARILKASLKQKGFIGHLGSDEFIVALSCKSEDDHRIDDFISVLQENVENDYEFAEKEYSLNLNLGRYYIEKGDGATSEEQINNVLYVKQTDKENRRKSDIGADQDYDAQEEAQVMEILDHNKLRYAYQPIVSAKSGEIIAYESLMRSDSEVMVSPLTILKYAERNKRLYDVEKYTFFNVLEQVKNSKDYPEDRRIFINSIPGYMLTDEDYELLHKQYGDLFERIVMEITEQREVDDQALADINIRRDKAGFNLAIDDYGSGYSNTNSLLRYMPQIVKLDRLLITGIDRNAKKQFFVNSIISFARDNDMMILAEGVETESELKTVIRLGVDMIQGYFTAKPSFDIIDSIADDIKKIIVDENLKVGNNQRMVYTASSNCELSAVQLAMENYTKINISGENVTIVGNEEYSADMVIRIKDGVNCNLTLSDVRLNSLDDEPCIEIGDGANLILNLEGNNRLNAKGIRVPEGSSLTIVGSGNLDIYAKGHDCYAIGNNSESALGKITLRGSGTLGINVDGELCSGIGGGIAGADSNISILSGSYKINIAGVEAVGIGCFNGTMPILIKDSETIVDFRVNTGLVIGTLSGTTDTTLQNFSLSIVGSGTNVCGIGSIGEARGNIRMQAGSFKIKLNGQKLYLLGCNSGSINIDLNHVRLDMIGEGDNVIGFGSIDYRSHMTVDETSMELIINASSPIGFGIEERVLGFKGPLATVKINGDLISMGA